MTLTFTFRDGTTTTETLKWAEKYEDNEYRRVRLDEWKSASGTFWRVSTIWEGMLSLGLGDGRPRTFETAIFRDDDLVGEMHHGTEAEALAAHEGIVNTLAETNDVDSVPYDIER